MELVCSTVCQTDLSAFCFGEESVYTNFWFFFFFTCYMAFFVNSTTFVDQDNLFHYWPNLFVSGMNKHRGSCVKLKPPASSVKWFTCVWPEFPVNWTWSPPNSAADQRCSSLSAAAEPQDLPLERWGLRLFSSLIDHELHGISDHVHGHNHVPCSGPGSPWVLKDLRINQWMNGCPNEVIKSKERNLSSPYRSLLK